MLRKFYRKDYQGEFLVKTSYIENGIRKESRDWVPNTIDNQQTSNCAVIIGNGRSRMDFNLNIIKNHRGGHLGKRKLQSYGCNALYRDFSPDFLVCVDQRIVNEIVDSGYADNNIVISSATNVIKYPGKLHLVPHNLGMNSGSLATYLACFDGHKQVYLLGFDNQPTANVNYNVYADTPNYDPLNSTVPDAKWINYMAQVFDTYHDVEFYRIVQYPGYVMPERWKYCVNLKQITFREFALSADL
jgi:hypothetical protein